LGDNACFIYTV